MSDGIITTNDNGNLVIGPQVTEPHLLTVAGAGTFLKGTLLARDTSTLKFVPFVIGGVTNGNGVPSAVLEHDVVASGAGDLSVAAIVQAKVNQNRLIVLADGDASNLTKAHLDTLRTYGIVAVDVEQLAVLDNQ